MEVVSFSDNAQRHRQTDRQTDDTVRSSSRSLIIVNN